VVIRAGAEVVKSITWILLSGTPFQLSPSLTQSSELATNARCRSGVIARLTGGPSIELINGRLATMRGMIGSAMSMIDTVSLPGGWFTTLRPGRTTPSRHCR
jgi:hypothetical protein